MRKNNKEMNETMLNQVNGGVIYCKTDSKRWKLMFEVRTDDDNHTLLGYWDCNNGDYKQADIYRAEAIQFAAANNVSGEVVYKDYGAGTYKFWQNIQPGDNLFDIWGKLAK